MAYQPKSYRKFIATAATATMVAGAVAPLATFAAETSFKDATGIYKTPVEYLVEKGFVNGVSKDEFGVSAKVKRGDAAVILSKALGLYATQAPDAGFTDLAAKYKDAVNPLKAAGIISGKTATEFKPDDFLTRGEVAIILAKAYKLEAKNQEALPFTDVNKNYAPFVKALVDNKVANGTTATTFGTASDITRGQMAIFLYNAINVTPEVKDTEAPKLTLKGDAKVEVEFGKEYTDAGVEVSDNMDKDIKATWEIKDAAGKVVTAIDTKVPGKYTITYSAVDKAGNKAETVTREVTVKEDVAKVESVTAVTSKTLKVKFNKAVDNTKAVFAVTKDTFKANVAGTSWNADKTEATIELTSKITAGEYVVSVTGLADTALTGSVKTADEKVTGIEILSDIAPLNSDNTASIGYKVVNQYGEDLTKLEDVEVSLSGAALESVTNGKLTFDKAGTTELKAGDKVVITLIHKASATSTTKTVTVSATAKASEVSFGTLYNKDGKTLNEDTNLSVDKFYLPLNVKDQYGNVITDANKIAANDLFLTNTNPLAVTADLATLTTIKINNVDTLVLPVNAPSSKTNAAAGESTLTVIAAASGKNAQAKVSVAEATRTDAVKFGTATVFAGEDTLVPVTVLDKNGNEIKDLKVLKDTVKGIKVTSKVGETLDELVEKDGSLFIKVAPLAEKNDVHTIVVQSSTNKVATVTLTAKDAIAPKVITGLNSSVSTAIREQADASVSIAPSKITVEDQYGQVIAADKLLAKLGSEYQIKAETVEGAPFTVGGTINKDGGAITVTYKAGQDRSSANVTFKLYKKDGSTFKAVESSAFAKEFTVVKDSSFASYKASDIGTVYVKAVKDDAGKVTGYTIPTNYEQGLEVKAVTNSGSEVTLTAGKDYTVKSTVVENSSDDLINGNDATGITFASGADTTTAKVTFTINATGQEIVKEVTFSKVAPKVETVQLVENNSVVSKSATELQLATLKAATPVTTNSTFDLNALEGKVDVVVTDQYGVRVALNEEDDTVTLEGGSAITPSITFSKLSGDVTFSNNGTANASVVAFSANSTFNTRLNVSSVSATPLKVTATDTLVVTP